MDGRNELVHGRDERMTFTGTVGRRSSGLERGCHLRRELLRAAASRVLFGTVVSPTSRHYVSRGGACVSAGHAAGLCWVFRSCASFSPVRSGLRPRHFYRQRFRLADSPHHPGAGLVVLFSHHRAASGRDGGRFRAGLDHDGDDAAAVVARVVTSAAWAGCSPPSTKRGCRGHLPSSRARTLFRLGDTWQWDWLFTVQTILLGLAQQGVNISPSRTAARLAGRRCSR